MLLLAALAALPADALVPLDGETPSLPQDGDRAFVWYHGVKWIGVLRKSYPSSHYHDRLYYSHVESNGRLYTAEQWGRYHSEYFVYIGYDGPTVWNAEMGMWEAHADHD